MIIFPAVDMRGGRCVRLLQGQAEQETVYDQDPLAVALRWQKEGASWLHLIDLDGAFASGNENRTIAKHIFKALQIPVQFGGGIREMKDVEECLAAGAARVILGTAAVRDPELLAAVVQRYKDQIVVGVDVRNGKVATQGWNQVERLEVGSFLNTLREVGVERVIHTDISRDGMLVGPNLDATRQLAEESRLKIIASGGVSCLEDLQHIRSLEPCGVEGVVVGKALYERRFSLAEALALMLLPTA